VRYRHVIGATTLALLATSCSLGDPVDAGSLNVYLSTDKATLAIGDSMTITVTAQNVGNDPLTFTGPSNCLMYIEVLTNQGQSVWNSNVTCVPGPTVTEEIAPGQDKVQSFKWDGTGLGGGRLTAGFYHIRAVALLTGAPYISPPLSIALE
jgi:hypothetical protein